jgi:quercetin dioxygenase-like cupin family protein
MDSEPQLLSLADLVQYQDGSVVSRTLVKKSTGTVTIFAFDTGESLSEHTAPFDALLYLFDGQAEIRIRQEQFHLKAGELLRLPANQPHAVLATTPCKLMLIMIREK